VNSETASELDYDPRAELLSIVWRATAAGLQGLLLGFIVWAGYTGELYQFVLAVLGTADEIKAGLVVGAATTVLCAWLWTNLVELWHGVARLRAARRGRRAASAG